MPDKIDAVLAKLDAIHTDVVALQTQMTALIGNGQPGRIQTLETRLNILHVQVERWRGALALLAFLLLMLGAADAVAAWRHLSP